MALANAVAGSIRPAQAITWTDSDGDPFDLTGATITGKLRNADGVVRNIAGSLVLSDAENGVFTWTYHTEDVVSGRYEVQFTATYGSGLTPARTIVTEWLVYEAIP
jgi:hypothetical protein